MENGLWIRRANRGSDCGLFAGGSILFFLTIREHISAMELYLSQRTFDILLFAGPPSCQRAAFRDPTPGVGYSCGSAV
jgi:hypothetical protein